MTTTAPSTARSGKVPPMYGVMFLDPIRSMDRLTLVVVNRGEKANFRAQVVGFISENGRRRLPTPWTIPWREQGSPGTWELAAGQKAGLDFAKLIDRQSMRLSRPTTGSRSPTGPSARQIGQ